MRAKTWKRIKTWDPSARKSNVSIKNLFKSLFTGANARPYPWLPLINRFASALAITQDYWSRSNGQQQRDWQMAISRPAARPWLAICWQHYQRHRLSFFLPEESRWHSSIDGKRPRTMLHSHGRSFSQLPDGYLCWRHSRTSSVQPMIPCQTAVCEFAPFSRLLRFTSSVRYIKQVR